MSQEPSLSSFPISTSKRQNYMPFAGFCTDHSSQRTGIYILQEPVGQVDLYVPRRYPEQTNEGLAQAYRRVGLVDNLYL